MPYFKINVTKSCKRQLLILSKVCFTHVSLVTNLIQNKRDRQRY